MITEPYNNKPVSCGINQITPQILFHNLVAGKRVEINRWSIGLDGRGIWCTDPQGIDIALRHPTPEAYQFILELIIGSSFAENQT
jgi:hypothetical protein